MSEIQSTAYNPQMAQSAAMQAGGSAPAKESETSNEMVDFLSLLLVQLENQDPTDPMDTNEMTNQMVSYSQLEQSTETNSQLENLNRNFLASSSFLAVSYLGTDMELNSTQSPVQSGAASWAYEVGGGVSETLISVSDEAGNLVYQAAGETDQGRYRLDLDLANMAGVTEDSVLTLSVTSLDAEGEKVPGNISSFVNVEMIDTASGAPQYQAGQLSFTDSDILKFYSSDADAI